MFGIMHSLLRYCGLDWAARLSDSGEEKSASSLGFPPFTDDLKPMSMCLPH